MIICGTNKKNLCEDYACEITKTDNGICISLTSDDKEKVAQLQKTTESCATDCCSADSKDVNCC